MAVYVQLLDDDGAVGEEAVAHVCTGDAHDCEAPLICHDHGEKATPENPVYGFTLADGFFGAACRNGIDGDFSRLVERVDPETDPETGAKIYPAMTPDGRPVESDGTVR